MSRHTGRRLTPLEHLNQSVADVLTTPKGTRVFRRDYGSRLFSMLDGPLNSQMRIDMIAETADAIGIWVPEFSVTRVELTSPAEGSVEIVAHGKFLPTGQDITLEGVSIR